MDWWVILIITVGIIALMGVFIMIIVMKIVHSIENDAKTALNSIVGAIEEGLAYNEVPHTFINYGDDLPTDIPPTPDFDIPMAQFVARVLMSIINDALEANPMYPPQFEVVRTIGQKQAVLLRRPQNGAPATATATGPFFYVLAFRGSLTFQDIQADLTFGQVEFTDLNDRPLPGSLVQSGFYDLWKTLQPELIEIRNTIRSGDTLMITGDSEGGPFAAFTAYDYSKHLNPDDMSYYIYESPMFGNNIMVRAAERAVPNHWFIRNVNDLIPNLPPPVTPLLNQIALYSQPRREYLVNIQTGSIANNHYINTNLCAVDPLNPVPECPANPDWVGLPRIPVLASLAEGATGIGPPVVFPPGGTG